MKKQLYTLEENQNVIIEVLCSEWIKTIIHDNECNSFYNDLRDSINVINRTCPELLFLNDNDSIGKKITIKQIAYKLVDKYELWENDSSNNEWFSIESCLEQVRAKLLIFHNVTGKTTFLYGGKKDINDVCKEYFINKENAIIYFEAMKMLKIDNEQYKIDNNVKYVDFDIFYLRHKEVEKLKMAIYIKNN